MTKLKPTQIIRAVCDVYNLKRPQLMGREKWQPLAFARQLAMVLCRERLNWTLVKTAKYFQKKDHATVIHAEKVVKERLDLNGKEGRIARGRSDAVNALLNGH